MNSLVNQKLPYLPKFIINSRSYLLPSGDRAIKYEFFKMMSCYSSLTITIKGREDVRKDFTEENDTKPVLNFKKK